MHLSGSKRDELSRTNNQFLVKSLELNRFRKFMKIWKIQHPVTVETYVTQ